MSGNAWEWCEDWYDENYYKQSPTDNPKGPNNGSYRVLRGGSWGNNPGYVRCAERARNYPEVRSNNDGFRVLLVPPQ